MTPELNRDIPSVHTVRLIKGAGMFLFFTNQKVPNPKADRAKARQTHVD